MTKPTPPSKKKTNRDPYKRNAAQRNAAQRNAAQRNAAQRGAAQDYLKYSGLAFQLLATVGLAAWGGIELDRYWDTRFPYATVGLVLLALTGSMIWLVRQLPQE